MKTPFILSMQLLLMDRWLNRKAEIQHRAIRDFHHGPRSIPTTHHQERVRDARGE